METLYFDDYEEFSYAVIDKLDVITGEDEFNDIAIIAKYEEARQIIKELLCIGCDINSVDIHDVEWDGYDDEYIVSVTKNDDNYDVWCEPFLRESGYITDDSKVIYVLDNCSSKVIPYCEGETVYEVSIGDESECDDCDGKCNCCNDYIVNGKRVGVDEYNAFVSKFAPDKVIKTDDKPVVTSKVEYKINNKCVDRDAFEKELTKFEDRYLDNIQDMLLRYADFMDEWNDLLKLFY